MPKSSTTRLPARRSSAGLAISPIAAALPAFPDRTGAALTQWLDETIDQVNRLVVESGNRLDAVADLIFRGAFLNSVRLALDSEAPLPPGVPELLERAGKSLSLTAYEVRRYAKIGALNHHVREGAWRNLPFHVKRMLVLLVDSPDDLSDFAEAVVFANKANVGPDAIRKFVNDRRPEKTEGPGKPRGITTKGASTVTARLAELDDEEARERLAVRLAELEDADARERLLDDMETAAKNLAKVVSAARQRVKKRGR